MGRQSGYGGCGTRSPAPTTGQVGPSSFPGRSADLESMPRHRSVAAVRNILARKGRRKGRTDGSHSPPLHSSGDVTLLRSCSALDDESGGFANAIPDLASVRQSHASNGKRFENTFRLFGGKYSILIDIRELEATMSDHHITMIAPRMRRLSTSRRSTQAASTRNRLFSVSLPVRRISVLSKAQKSVKMAQAA